MRWILGAAVVTAREAVTFLAVTFVAVNRKGYTQNNFLLLLKKGKNSNFLLPTRWKEWLALRSWVPIRSTGNVRGTSHAYEAL